MQTKKEKLAVKKLEDIIDGTNEKEEVTTNPIDSLGLGKISDRLTGEEKLKFISYISDSQASDYSILFAVNEELDSNLLEAYLINRLSLGISIKGRGRNDIVELTKNLSGVAMAMVMGGDGENKTGLLRKLKEKVG